MTAHKILIVTGLSGAGMSSALKSLEDMGYEVFDNFPPALIDPLLADTKAEDRPLAVGIDSRARGFDPVALLQMTERLKARLVFITADDAVLQKRFTETRRRHPMAKDRPVAAGIKKEQEMLHALRRESDVTIDTSDLSVHDLKRLLEGHFGLAQRKMTVSLVSFGFRFGIPREADLLMDIRFLNNPHWIADLKPLTGLDAAVGAYIDKDKDFAPFCAGFKAMLEPLLPRYAAEGKSYLTIALGCTGGRHRSVYTVETLKPWLEEQGFAVNVIHRDIDR